MTNEFAADQYFTTLLSMLLKGWLTQEHHDELQGKVNQWADGGNVHGVQFDQVNSGLNLFQ